MDQYVGEIRIFAGPFAPENWQLCDGSLLSIANYQVLYTLLGTVWGGDGNSTFGVPDLRNRLPVGQGTGGGLTPRVLGQVGGTDSVTLTNQNLPNHNHLLVVSGAPATTVTVSAGACFASPTSNQQTGVLADYVPTDAPSRVDWTLAPQAIAPYGGNGPHENRMPSQSINYIIATVGVFPSRP